jgi:hypothetical protein
LRKFVLAGVLVLMAGGAIDAANAATIPLGPFNFDSNLFGNALVESDGGALSAGGWLNTTNVDPGNPGYLTGANFDTGIANLNGDSTFYPFPLPPQAFTIFYSNPISNGVGNDFAIVDANFSMQFFEGYDIAVSTDGVAFSPSQWVPDSSGISTGVTKTYFCFCGGGPGQGYYQVDLNVMPLDLALFGIAAGDSITAIQITGIVEADLIRVAGFQAVPEPSTALLLGLGLTGLAAKGRRRNRS